MSDHFSLDVHPETLRNAVRSLERLGEHLATKAGTVKATPDEIGDSWTGAAATSIKAEMRGLGGHMATFSSKLERCRRALARLAEDYDDALTQVGDLNRRWNESEDTYSAAVGAADRQRASTLESARPDNAPLNRAIRDEIDQVRTHAVSAAAEARRETQHNLEYSFGMLRQWVAQQTRTAEVDLQDSLPLPVPPDAISAYRSTGTFPVRLDRSVLERSMTLTGRFHEQEVQQQLQEEGREAAEALMKSNGDVSEELAAEILAQSDNPYFAHGFAADLDPAQLAQVVEQFQNLTAMDPERVADPTALYNDLVVGIGTTIATATRGTGDLALPDDYAARWADAMTESTVFEDGDATGRPGTAQRLALFLEQGKWGTEFLDSLGTALYDYEIDHGPGPVWGPKSNHLNPVQGPDGMVRIDVMASLMEALGNNPEAAQQFFTTGGTTELDLDGQSLEVSERMQYLIQERGWSHMTDPTNGSNLGEALRAATTEYRDQTEQGRTSAELATQMFLLIGDKTGDGSSDGFLGMGGDEGWEMWDGMRDEVAEVVASYAPDLLRIAQRDAADRLDGLSVAPEEDLYGDGAPYGAALDPDLMQKIIGTLAENDDHMDTVLAGVGAATDIRISTALHDALGDQASVPAPVALLLGNTVPEISSATDESASALGWVLNAGYHGRLDDEEFEKKQAEARAALFDTLTSVPGVGPAGKWSSAVFNETVKHISTGIKKTDATAGSDYGELSAGEREHLEQMILNKLLSQGYLEDEYVDEANGGQGDRFSAPPRSAVISGDPPRFDFESDEYLAWRRDRFPYDDFLNSHVFPGFTMKLNAGLSLGGR